MLRTKGRATRIEFFNYFVTTYLLTIIGAIFAATSSPDIDNHTALSISIFIFVFFYIPRLAASFRRLHDLNLPAIAYLIAFIPVAGQILFLFMFFAKGTKGDNPYGADPLMQDIQEGDDLSSAPVAPEIGQQSSSKKVTETIETRQRDEDQKTQSKKTSFIADVICTVFRPWQERPHLHKIYTASFVVIFIGLFNAPYEYYTFLRVIVCASLCLFAVELFKAKQQYTLSLLVCLCLIVLYNPFSPIHLGDKGIWSIINVATLYALYKIRYHLGEVQPLPDLHQAQDKNKNRIPPVV